MAFSLFRKRVKLDAPDSFDALFNRGLALQASGEHEQALAAFDRAILLRGDHAETHANRGNALYALGRPADAAASYRRALELDPGHVPAAINIGHALFASGRLDDAIAAFDRVLARDDRNAAVLNGRAIVLSSLGRHREALEGFDRALAIAPGFLDARVNRGNEHQALGQVEAALADYDEAALLSPESPTLAYNRGVALLALRRYEAALASFTRAVDLQRDHVSALYSLGVVLGKLGRTEDALASFESALAIDPDFPYLLGYVAEARAKLCAWDDRDRLVARIVDAVKGAKLACDPFILLGLCDDLAVQRECASLHVRNTVRGVYPVHRRGGDAAGRIRIAYVSGDFREHPVAFLIAGLIEQHDRNRFEVVGISLRSAPSSPIRTRLEAAFDRFLECGAMTDAGIAEKMRELGIDIAVDLMGHTLDARPGIFARRPAAVQVNYLGYPGTLGAEFIDYIIGDRFVIPPESDAWYAEQVVRLPDTFQASDRARLAIGQAATRESAGLPSNGFVFCCFNNSYKIAPAMFDVWMRLLRKAPESVLWLLAGEPALEANLRLEASARGIDPARLFFARRTSYAEYLGRYRLADLFLDTLPFNAGTTASDALAAGLPVVTCAGKTFASRMAGSLLHAVGLPEMATSSLDDYEARALGLACDPSAHSAMRAKLASNLPVSPLFDGERFRRHLELAYTTMIDTHRSGAAPRSFIVEHRD